MNNLFLCSSIFTHTNIKSIKCFTLWFNFLCLSKYNCELILVKNTRIFFQSSCCWNILFYLDFSFVVKISKKNCARIAKKDCNMREYVCVYIIYYIYTYVYMRLYSFNFLYVLFSRSFPICWWCNKRLKSNDTIRENIH